jgi:hypothetical protein
VLARCIATAAALSTFIGCSLPLIAVMRQAAGRSLAEAGSVLLPFAALVVFVATITTAATLLCRHRLGGWTTATLATAAMAYVLTGQSAAWWLVIAVMSAVPLLLWADSRLSYLSGGQA